MTDRYMVELDVIDMTDAPSGGDRVLKLRFNLNKLTREALRHAVLQELLLTTQFTRSQNADANR